MGLWTWQYTGSGTGMIYFECYDSGDTFLSDFGANIVDGELDFTTPAGTAYVSVVGSGGASGSCRFDLVPEGTGNGSSNGTLPMEPGEYAQALIDKEFNDVWSATAVSGDSLTNIGFAPTLGALTCLSSITPPSPYWFLDESSEKRAVDRSDTFESTLAGSSVVNTA